MARTSTKSKVVKSIPSSEIKLVTCFTKPNKSGDKYLITYYPIKEQYTLWKYLENEFEKISISNTPVDFDDIIPYEK